MTPARPAGVGRGFGLPRPGQVVASAASAGVDGFGRVALVDIPDDRHAVVPQLLALIEDRSAALSRAVAAAPDSRPGSPAAPTGRCATSSRTSAGCSASGPPCVHAADVAGPPSPDVVGDRDPHGDLLDWSAESTRLLLAALGEAGPDTACWTWWAASGAPHDCPARWPAIRCRRRPCTRTTRRRRSAGRSRCPAAIAVDGMSEFLVGQPRRPRAPGRTARPAWCSRPPRARPGRSTSPPAGAQLDPAAGGRAGGHRRTAPASDLVLALYQRMPLTGLRIDGDAEVVQRLSAWTDTE